MIRSEMQERAEMHNLLFQPPPSVAAVLER